jgi:RNase adaptor protein for sRNA GlmZ degradation
MDDLPLIKVVGISASGKSTLVGTLRQLGYNARAASQEHSEVAHMWQRIHPPQVLIYLYADLATQQERRPDVQWSEGWLETEEKRLHHARDHADLFVDTRGLLPAETANQVLAYLQSRQIAHSDHPLSDVPATGSSHTSSRNNS